MSRWALLPSCSGHRCSGGLWQQSRRGLPGSCCRNGVGSETGPLSQPPEVHPLGSPKHTWAVSCFTSTGVILPSPAPCPSWRTPAPGAGQRLPCPGRCSLPATSEGSPVTGTCGLQRGSRRCQDSLCFPKQSSGCFIFLRKRPFGGAPTLGTVGFSGCRLSLSTGGTCSSGQAQHHGPLAPFLVDGGPALCGGAPPAGGGRPPFAGPGEKGCWDGAG